MQVEQLSDLLANLWVGSACLKDENSLKLWCQVCRCCRSDSYNWPDVIDSCQERAEKPLITYMHLSYLNAQFYSFMQIAMWRPYWIELENCSMCSNYRVFVWLFALRFIDCSPSKAEKSSITNMHLSYLNTQFYAFMQIALWRPYRIKSENCSTCSNYRLSLIHIWRCRRRG